MLYFHKKNIGYMLRGTCIETLPRPQEFKCTDNALPDIEIPGSATIHHRGHMTLASVVERWQWSCHYRFYDYGLSRLGMEPFRIRVKRSFRLRY